MSHPLNDPSIPRPVKDPGAGELATVMLLITQLRQLFSSPSYRPPLLPTVALEVHELTFRPDVDASRLVAVLEKDAMLAAQVLRVAGSAAFGGWGGDVSLKDAVVRLGLKNLNSVVWEVAANLRVFRSTHYAPLMEQVRTHSMVSAHLCRFVAIQRQIPAESAFLCGLLHDIGIAATLLVLADQVQGGHGIDPVLLDLVLRETHQEISGLIARLWHLPTEMEFVLANHHNGTDPDKVTPLSAVVAVAEDLGQELGYGVMIGAGRCDEMDPVAVKLAYEMLAFTDEERRELISTVGGLVSMVAGGTNAQAKSRAPGKAAVPRDRQPPSAIKTGSARSGVRSPPRTSWMSRLRQFFGF
jgi:HD-like signal output (HDOD) protein